ncbi:hypothetical protein DFH08DRAFT_710067 [Mycena albidolilacea]|uniref:CxC1-like cysteine cluster associated with KDZ transposases domain-containing protein n=1 Tax=Mycena albidolilacea TaxID=1033008 RepID=A0AAD7EIZ5_9AGAR|nr:hypothetical protein DFH08DRAFT_710067 [Mycena albidolilacea]
MERTPPPDPTKHRRKRAAQWQRWEQETLPKVLPHFALLLHETKSLREMDGRQPRIPSGACQHKTHKIAVMRFATIEDLEIQVCACAPAAVQLMQLGAFGCAPILPSLAVDVRVLEFAMNLFVQISPNNTAFTNTLERVLGNMGFQLDHQNSLRRRFGNCLMWYTHLRNLLKAHYNSKLEKVREDIVGPQIIPESPPTRRGHSAERGRSRADSSSVTPTPRRGLISRSRSPAASDTPPRAKRTGKHVRDTTPTQRRGHSSRSRSAAWDTPPRATGKRAREPTPAPRPDPPFPDPQNRLRPSEYLRRRCPACFANLKRDHSEEYVVDIMVCLDACFTQKKKKSPRDPQKTHPDTHFVPEHTAALTEEYVEYARDTKSTAKEKRHKPATVQEVEEEAEDGYEFERLPLPRSVLDGCEASFKAADEKREKASTEFFEDTALMGLLCRHDRVLWVVNMHSAGEKQFNVIALIETLFQHLPRDIRVGILYDVACTLERSCLKWGLLSRYIGRVAFAVSVFHAFGHEWACQLLYHPRKRVGFGFTNGEGCERFWKSIQHLIAHLRICGYHNRLYTLDAQIEHADEASRFRLGEWIGLRYRHCRQKRSEATNGLRKCGRSEVLLREQWKLQVLEQTQPLPRRSKTRGEKAVNSIVLLRAAVKMRRAQTVMLMKKFVEAAEEDHPNTALYQAEWETAEKALKKAEDTLLRKETELGVDESDELERLSKSEYARDVMNAHALKLRLRERLRARKFEFDPVERTCRRLATDDKLRVHTESAIKRREPTITKIAAEYNKLCAKIAKLIKAGQAPRGAIAPVPIPPNGLWQLDVDDAIFQDVGLYDRDADGEPPLWLCDEKVRAGIKAVLELDRCDEEDVRLQRETLGLRVWFREEWEVAVQAIDEAGKSASYHLQLHQDKLVRLCATWDKCLPDFAEMGPLPLWGPSSSQLSKCRVDAHTAARGEDRHYSEDNTWSDDEEESEESGGEDDDFGIVEAVERADLYRNDGIDEYVDLEN